MKNNNSPKKIIIIGAGIAGLAAGSRLIEYGFDVTILEARERIGGRIWTDYSLDIPLGKGANWVHGIKNNPIADLVEKVNSHSKIVVVDPDKFITFNRNGKVISHNDIQFNVKFKALLEQAKALAFASEEDISLSEAFLNLSKEFSVDEQDLFQTERISFESYLGAGYESLSARNWDQDDGLSGDNCFLINGYEPLLDHLKNKCNIALNMKVEIINLRDNDVEIITENTSFFADAVIITLPLGILKRNTVVFNPPLPDLKLKAIENLEMGVFNILALQFKKQFWPNENHAMFFPYFDSKSISVFFNLCHFVAHPILLGLTGGNRAIQLEDITDEDLIEKTMNNFKSIFGKNIPEPISYFNTRWSKDSFCYGSFSYTAIGSGRDDYDALAESISDRLFFAGEATYSKNPATTHGAYLSGIREAEKIKSIYK